jgi:hypothetical protein
VRGGLDLAGRQADAGAGGGEGLDEPECRARRLGGEVERRQHDRTAGADDGSAVLLDEGTGGGHGRRGHVDAQDRQNLGHESSELSGALGARHGQRLYDPATLLLNDGSGI